MDASNIEFLISKGDEEGVRGWARSTLDWREMRVGETGDSSLHLAVRLGQDRVVRTLLELGHPPDTYNTLKETPLMLSCDFSFFPICHSLTHFPSTLSQTDLQGCSSLHHAAAAGSTACLSLLLSLNCAANATDFSGDSPLHLAALNGRSEAVRVLIDNKADIEAKNKEGERPVHKAAAASDPTALAVLIEKGCDLNPEAMSRRTPIGIAIRAGNLPIVETLVKAGVKATKHHIKIAKEASRIAVWRYLQDEVQRPSVLASSVSSGEESPAVGKEIEANLRIKELLDEREALLAEISGLKQQLSTAVMPTGIPGEELTLGEVIGRGSYGEVHRGRWKGTEVAVKRLVCEGLESEFRGEAMLMQRLRHPNVVLALGMCTNPPALVVEYVPLGSLYTLLHRSKSPLSLSLLYSMALDISRAMLYLHTHSPPILHRDLNPANCLVTSDFHIKICDFGLARLKSANSSGSKSLGTVQYSAPEFISEQRFTPKSDVYSFGVLLWEMITRDIPFSGLQPVQVVYAVVNNTRRPATTADMPQKQLIERCWSQDPELRPNFEQIISHLEALLQ